MDTYTTIISASSSFCASLKLPASTTDGKCTKEHGYTFIVLADIAFVKKSDSFFFDYNVLEKNLSTLCDKLDYSNLNKNPNLKNIIPSSENIAKWFIQSLENILNNQDYTSISIKVSTKPGSSVTIQKNVK